MVETVKKESIMSYKNFIPKLWNEEILKERDEVLVAGKICNRDYEGDVKQKGDTVKILGVGRPTINDYDDEIGLGDFERLPDQSTMLEITEQKAFHFYVGDIDKRQSVGDLMSAEKKEASAALAEVADSFIYNKIAKEAGIAKSVTSLTASNVMSTISGALTELWKNGVPRNEKIYLEVSPNFVEKLMLANVLVNTDNSKIITSGAVGTLKVFNIEVHMSTNLKNTAADGDYCVARTKKAVTFADALTEIKAYEPDNFFGEAIKGLQVYGAKVIRPKECAIIKVKAYGAETNI